ncbi:MAG: Phosphoglycerol transferase I (EC [uncultured Campylobacterales bacterium]|uniref:Phosphoglycerol transferase I (EC) n=1 Tax=uncultured Campylobacterales bacterium TaxID=352960 RepID=A0A6S6SL12_9BACT|nr:MAG: Phosphoglycerol transferase I (EC [uncultured Campylobacterales bacterium]
MLYLSLVLFLLGIYLFIPKRSWFISQALITISILGFILLSILYIVSDYFTGAGFDEAVLFHILFGVKGSATNQFGLYTGVALFSVVFYFFANKLYKKTRKNKTKLVYLLIFIAFVIHPVSKNLYDVFLKPKIELALDPNPLVFDEVYTPLMVTNKKNQTKNLVLIYLESLEDTFSNNNIFPELTPNLDRFKKEGISFSNMNSVTGTGWTIAGMVSSQCGISLFTHGDASSLFGIDEFLPKANCLGDMLGSRGYYQEYIGGARLKFAGKGKFYTTHGYDNVYGYNHIKSGLKNQTYQNYWGLYDDTMFDFAYGRFLKASKISKEQKTNFALTLLTLDTHVPKGSVSKSCPVYKNSSNKYLNSIYCSDYLVGKFVDKVLKEDNNTIVVLLSDHLAQRNVADYLYLKKMQRRNRFVVLNSGFESYEIDTLGSHLDVANTIMPFLGFDISGGLGQNLIKPFRDKNLTLKIHTSLAGWKKDFLAFWEFEKIKQSILISKDKLTIDGKKEFVSPILLELDDELNISPKFEFFLLNTKKDGLISQAKQLKQYLLVYKCKEIEEEIYNATINNKKNFCALFSSSQNKKLFEIKEDNIIFDKHKIKKYLGIN